MPLPRHQGATPILWYVLLVETWHIPSGLAWDAWQALYQSQASEPRELCHQVLLYNGQSDFEYLIHQTLSPEKLMKCLELVCKEQRLSREQTTRLENLVLPHVDRAGQWKE